MAAIGLPNERLGKRWPWWSTCTSKGHWAWSNCWSMPEQVGRPQGASTRVFFSEEALPRNATNKNLKTELKTKYAAPPRGNS